MGPIRVAVVGLPPAERTALRSALRDIEGVLAPLGDAEVCIAAEEALNAVLSSVEVPVFAWNCTPTRDCAGSMGIDDLDESLPWILAAAVGRLGPRGAQEQSVLVRPLLDCAVSMADPEIDRSRLFRESDGDGHHVQVIPSETVAHVKAAMARAWQPAGCIVLKTERSGHDLAVRIFGYPEGGGPPYRETLQLPLTRVRAPRSGSINSGWNWFIPERG